MADVLTLSFEDTLGPVLDGAPESVGKAVKHVVESTADKVFQRIKNDTPRDRGQAGGAVSRWKQERRTTAEGKPQVVLANDAPHINVLEYGGYPVIPASRAAGATISGGFVRGRAILGAGPPGPRTIRAPGGDPPMNSNVSHQAPRGMVRQNLNRVRDEFIFDLEEAIDRAFAEGGP